MGLRTISICAGIGSLDIGLKIALPEALTVLYLEREARSIATLVARIRDKRLDDAPVWSDVKTFSSGRWRGKVDCIIGGYPCQPFSISSRNRLGVEDERNIWPHIARIIADIQPTLCFFENVPNHLKEGFEQVRADLRTMGYEVEADLRDAAEVGGTQKRKRLFILAYRDSQLRGCSITRELLKKASEGSAPGLEGSDSAHLGGRLFPPFLNGRWDNVPDSLKPAIRRMADGDGDRLDRVVAVGNGVVPLVAAYAFKTLSTKVLTNIYTHPQAL